MSVSTIGRAVLAVVLAGLLSPLLLESGPAAAQEAGSDTSLQGRLTAVVEGERQGVEGVEIVVEQDGEEVGTATTGEDGSWEVEIPGAGTYAVTLVTDTLPEGVSLRDPERETIEITARAGRRNGVIFALGEGAGGGANDLERFVNLSVEGIKLGSVIAMTAIGLSLIFGVTGLVNFAHGELVTFGALTAWYLNAWGSGPEMHLIPAGILAVVAGGGLGWGLERGLFRPLRRRQTGLIALIVVTIGLSLLLRHVYLIFFGGGSKPYLDYTVQRATDFGPISLPPKDYAIIVISLLVLALVGVLLLKTQLGTAMRAVADDRDLAESSGIDVRKVILATWVGGAALAALGGVLQGTTERVTWDMGFTILLLIFAAVIVGGLGTAFGAMVGGLVIGYIVQVSTLWVDVEFKLVVALGALIVVLLFRPQGILGQAERVG